MGITGIESCGKLLSEKLRQEKAGHFSVQRKVLHFGKKCSMESFFNLYGYFLTFYFYKLQLRFM